MRFDDCASIVQRRRGTGDDAIDFSYKRIFVNTIDHAIRLMTDNGVPATAHREERDGYIEYTVRIPTAAAQR